MIGFFVLLGIFIYCFIIILMLAIIDQFSFINSKYGILKFFGWPIYFPLKIVKEILLFLYCDVFIRTLDKYFKKK